MKNKIWLIIHLILGFVIPFCFWYWVLGSNPDIPMIGVRQCERVIIAVGCGIGGMVFVCFLRMIFNAGYELIGY